MPLDVQPFINGKWRQNCYLLGNEHQEALIIDPGSGAADIISLLHRRNWRPLAIFNTHAHYDHIGAIADLVDHYGIHAYMHGGDMELLKRANMYKLIFESTESVRLPADIRDLRNEPIEIHVGHFSFSWLAAPGHTPGGVCFHLPGHLFTGDTLLRTGAGRTDLPGGNQNTLVDSLKRLAALPGDTTIHAGHGRPCSLSAALAQTGINSLSA